MKYYFLIICMSVFTLNSCQKNPNHGTSKTATEAVAEENEDLDAQQFSAKIAQDKNAEIIDVRTPEEFAGGHITNAKNIDINGADFDQEISKLDKSKPVFVYCLSGGRSAKAGEIMRNSGFSKVYELNGGMMAWRSANLPETTDSSVAISGGMTRQEFDHLINSDKTVLVDFYADWCEPCKKMKPYLDEISKTMTDKVKVVRIDADKNVELCKELKVSALPVLQIYKNGKMTWQNLGFVPKETVVSKLD